MSSFKMAYQTQMYQRNTLFTKSLYGMTQSLVFFQLHHYHAVQGLKFAAMKKVDITIYTSPCSRISLPLLPSVLKRI